MGKLRFICLALCICIGLIACTATDSGNLFGTGAKEDGFVPGQLSPDESYQYGNMQKSPGGEFLRLGNEVLFTFIPEGATLRLYSYDLTTGKANPYCGDATCKHSSCVSGSLSAGLEVYQGRLYALNKARQAVEIDGEEMKTVTKGQVGDFFHHDGKIYILTAADRSLAVMEEGNDEIRVIAEAYTGIGTVIFGDYLYATTLDQSIIRVNLTDDVPEEEVLVANACGMTDGQHIYYVDSKSNYLYRCDLDGSNAKLLVEQEVLLASINFDNEYFYYRLKTQPVGKGEDSYDLYRFPKNNPQKTEKFATLPVSAYQVYTVPGADVLFVTAYVRSNGESNDIYVVKKDGSSITRLEIPEY